MAEKAIIIIKKAEAEARAAIEKVHMEAEEIVNRAEKETANALSMLLDKCKEQALENKRQAEIDAKRKCGEFSSETAQLCAALKEKLSEKKQISVDAVIQIITA